MQRIQIALMVLFSFLASCKSRNTKSKTKIDDGYLVVEASGYMPGVVGIGRKPSAGEFVMTCSATSVSDSTLLTAAHCVSSRAQEREATLSDAISKSPIEFCVSLPTLEQDETVCQGKAYFPKGYYLALGSDRNNFDYDIAVIVFPKKTFKYIHNIDLRDSLKSGDEGIIVGFSKEFLQEGEFPKRWGRSRIVTYGEASREAEITSEKLVSNPDEQAVSPGDSGGPMFSSQCTVTGVASRMGLSENKYSLHTRVKITSSIEFLKLAEEHANASICGLNSLCEGSFVVQKISVAGRLKFPCRASSEDTNFVLIAAMKRAEEINNKLKQSTTDLVACKDNRSIQVKAGYATQCLESTLRDSSNKNKDCPSREIHVNGQIASISETSDSYDGLPLAPESSVLADLATRSSNYLSKKSRKKLNCANKGAPKENQCCFEVSCKSLSRSDGRAVVGETVKCNREIEPNEFVNAARYSSSNGIARLIPDQVDLQSLPFSCENPQSMSWRSTFGICWEDLRENSAPSSTLPNEGTDFVCWRVEKGNKTANEKPCPDSVKRTLVSSSGGI